ncbi:MAG: hypothetical protein H7296_15340 [Bacteroidia bacterium]|nr:hypothetical protein [Bacteroidia bacterium]
MAPLLILPLLFGLLFALNKYLLHNNLTLSLIGLIPISIMLTGIGIAHFIYTDSMVEMMPDIIPMKKEIVYFTGILEFFASVGLLIKRLTRITSIMLIIFFVAVLPANIVGSIKELPLGGMNKGINFLYFRIPLQLLFMAWIYWFGIRLSLKDAMPAENHF